MIFYFPKIHHARDTRGSHAPIWLGHSPSCALYMSIKFNWNLGEDGCEMWPTIWLQFAMEVIPHPPQLPSHLRQEIPHFLNLHLWLSLKVAHKFPRHPHWKSVNVVTDGDGNNINNNHPCMRGFQRECQFK